MEAGAHPPDLDLRTGPAAVRTGLPGRVAAGRGTRGRGRRYLRAAPCPGSRSKRAELIAFYLPMHTATRLFLRVIDRVRAANPTGPLVRLRTVRAAERGHAASARASSSIIGGEFEPGLVRGRSRAASRPRSRLERQQFLRARPPGPSARWGHMRAWSPTAPPGASGTPKPRAAASICAGTARWCRCTAGSSAIVQQDVVLGGHPAAGRRRSASTSPSAIPISSTARATPCASSRRCTANGRS